MQGLFTCLKSWKKIQVHHWQTLVELKVKNLFVQVSILRSKNLRSGVDHFEARIDLSGEKLL